MKAFSRRLLRQFGYELARSEPADLTPEDRRILKLVRPFTMTSTERLLALISAVRYVCQNNIGGDIAECGVWRGGSMMAVALTLLSMQDQSRELHLYDTFQGMSSPSAEDKDLNGAAAEAMLLRTRRGAGIWCEASLEDVRANLLSTGYPASRVHYHVGKVEETIPQHLPGPLAVLRLDTDWYESTRHELEHLFPMLVQHGVLILDDYGHWQGAKKATDEYFAGRRHSPLLHRLDYTGRMVIKTEHA